MKIICGYVEGSFRPEARAAIECYAPETELLDFTGNDYAYWEALKAYWNKGEDLMVIEQDIEITAEVIPSFTGCKRHWCTFEYQGRVGASKDVWNSSLGCTRYSAELQSAASFGPRCHWLQLDLQMQAGIRAAGYWCSHVHGLVNHFHYISGEERRTWEQRMANKPPPVSKGTCHCGEEFASYLRGVTMCPKHQAESMK